MKELEPGEYTSDDLDRLVREADRKAAKLRHVDTVLGCPKCGYPSLTAAWEVTYEHAEGCDYDPVDDEDCGPDCLGDDTHDHADDFNDDGYRYDPVEGESRVVER